MASIPIHNETDYTLTEAMTQQIIRDAEEHFGEEVHAIRVQAGLARHALNVRTREVRYAFSPQDFGLGHTMPTVQETPQSRRRSSRSKEEPAAALLPGPGTSGSRGVASRCCPRGIPAVCRVPSGMPEPR